MGLIAELVGYALLGRMQKEKGLGLHMMVIMIDTGRFRQAGALAAATKEVLGELRCFISFSSWK